MEEVTFIKFPLHQRRMVIFAAKHNEDALPLLRELVEHIHVAD